MTKRIWDDLITEQDREVYGSGVFGGGVGVGKRPAVLVIDVLNKSIGDEPLPILEAMRRFGKSCCGEYGWATIPKIQTVLEAAHDAGLPVFYTTPQDPEERPPETFRRFDEKMPNWYDYAGDRAGYAFADEIAPIPSDHIFHKPTASSFYLTDFEDQLHKMDVDTLIVTGCATSGCVRASVVDGACPRLQGERRRGRSVRSRPDDARDESLRHAGEVRRRHRRRRGRPPHPSGRRRVIMTPSGDTEPRPVEPTTCRRYVGRNVFITGAGAGIGKATAERILEEGGTVFITDRNKEALAAAVEELSETRRSGPFLR